VQAHLLATLNDKKIVDWLCTNLVKEREGLVWRAGIDNILANYRSIANFPTVTNQFGGPTLAVVGETSEHTVKSKALGPGMSVKDLFEPLFPKVEVKVIEGAGHWLHFERPGEVTGVLERFLG
jgi:pimeloyl-ACP methyl ester carboxylesterase